MHTSSVKLLLSAVELSPSHTYISYPTLPVTVVLLSNKRFVHTPPSSPNLTYMLDLISCMAATHQQECLCNAEGRQSSVEALVQQVVKVILLGTNLQVGQAST